MLHVIAFVVIGVVVGLVLGRRGPKNPALTVVLALAGALAAGFWFREHKYLSLLTSLVGSAVLGYIGVAVSPKKS
jgi:uncharacterized membrane protein YeaQ/YmgE (transglycosylase-associated protein family)